MIETGKEARRAVREARVQSLHGASHAAAGAAAAAALARRARSDVEAPLLPHSTLPYADLKDESEQSWHGKDGSVVNAVVGLFMPRAGLGTGLALRSDSSLLNPHRSPGLFAPAEDAKALRNMLTSSWINLLLLCLPVALWAGLAGRGAIVTFSLNFLSLIPLALFLGEVTEDLALRFGDVVGGLLNATFGNVVELLLGLSALRLELYDVVAASLIGSILSNLLLVLGTSFFFGGLKYKEQRFSTLTNKVSCSLLFLACIGIIVPSTGRMIYGRHVITHKVLANLSHGIAAVLLGIYFGYLLFQLATHKDLFEGEDNGEADGEAPESPALSLSAALGCLTIITAIVAACSALLCGSIQEVADQLDINQAFLGLIVLPIAGNVVEHLSAVFVAVNNKMDLSIGIALGSSIQVAIGIIPITVLAGWAMGKDFLLDFDQFAVTMLTASVVLAYFVCSDGRSNWLLGLQLVATYALIAFIFALEKEPAPPGPSPLPPAPPASPKPW